RKRMMPSLRSISLAISDFQGIASISGSADSPILSEHFIDVFMDVGGAALINRLSARSRLHRQAEQPARRRSLRCAGSKQFVQPPQLILKSFASEPSIDRLRSGGERSRGLGTGLTPNQQPGSSKVSRREAGSRGSWLRFAHLR